MDDSIKERLRHLWVAGAAETLGFTARNQGGRRAPGYPHRNPDAHGRTLALDLATVSKDLKKVQAERDRLGLDDVTGSLVTFEVVLHPDLSLDSFEDQGAGIERVAFQILEGDRGLVTVFVPDGRLRRFEAKIAAYLDLQKATLEGKRRNEPLLNSINRIRRAVLKDLWTDPARSFPTESSPIWWEIWLRSGVKIEDVRQQAARLRITLGESALIFPDRIVILAHANIEQMVASVDLLDWIAELRSARSLGCRLLETPSREVGERVDRFRERIERPSGDAPAVCILDTGVDIGHPLLEPGLDPGNAHSYNPQSWGVDDRHGHGTQMAGFALFGDRLEELLSVEDGLDLRHQLESVKILRAPGTNPPELYGEITLASAARAEVHAPFRRRVFSLSVTDPETCSPRGEPSSWSGALDLLCSGSEEADRPRRLVFVSSGNANYGGQGYIYPDSNLTDTIHDPGQSWNAVTIGAFTEKDLIHEKDCRDWQIVAPAGDMSPCNTTSLTWAHDWPNKPDLVLEGGNMAWDPTSLSPEPLDSLSLLTTRLRRDSRLLCPSGETSAATACAARLGILTVIEYPELWPETLRALLIHSARWTPAMEERFRNETRRRRMEHLLQCFGWGVPDLQRALYSLRNQTTLIIQEAIQPFRIDGSQAKSSQMHLHRLPWPREVLASLGEAQVRLRVTLSYFIEPKPGKRGPSRRHRYASHGLRFEVKTATEEADEFLRRINRAFREESEPAAGGSDSQEWLIGPQGRSRGSVHSDVWAGTAADLAAKDAIAIFPTLGWWRDPKRPDRCERQVRYALVVSIESDETTVEVEGAFIPVDFYTEIVNQIEISGTIEILGA
jgi:hypothetical protein